MKKSIFLVLFLPFCKIVSAQSTIGNSILFIYDNEQKIAKPIVIYKDGKYLDLPNKFDWDLAYPKMSSSEINQKIRLYDQFENELSTYKTLYLLNNGIKCASIDVIKTTKYNGASVEWPALQIASIPQHNLLSNNPKLGTNTLQKLDKNDRPKLKKRRNTEYGESGFYPNNLISKVDIDGDGLAELVYECIDYESWWIEIYSKKNGRWKKVYEGAGDGS